MLTYDNNFSEWFNAIGSAISWLETVFEGLVDTIMGSWLVWSFLCTMIVISALALILSFLNEASEMSGDHFVYKMRKSALEAQREERHKRNLSESDKRYKERRDEQRRYYEELYRSRNSNKEVLSDSRAQQIHEVVERSKTQDLIYEKKNKNTA